MTRYTEINKIIQFIGEGVDANKDIVLGDTKNLKIIAEKYVELKYNKKIAKKKSKIQSKYYKENQSYATLNLFYP